MTLRLTADDQRRLAAATESLLAPQAPQAPQAADGGVDAWWHEVEARLGALVPGANALLAVPENGRLRFLCGTAPAAPLRLMQELTEVDLRTGLMQSPDPVPAWWYRHRRRHGIGVWDEPLHVRLLTERGMPIERSPFRHEGLRPAGLHQYAGITSEHYPAGELIVTVGYPAHRRPRFGEDEAALLALLLPALRVAHHAHTTAAARTAAAVALLDAGAEALLVLAPDGRTLHRNAALGALLAAEPERERLEEAMARAAHGLRALRALHTARADASSVAATLAGAPPQVDVATARARYAVRARLAPVAVWGAPGVALVSVARDAGVPSAEAAARALGLTPREAEVARLLADRLTNAELAGALGISAHTARHHTQRVMQKLGVDSRRELAMRLRSG